FRSSYDSLNASLGLFWSTQSWNIELQSLTQWRAYQRGSGEVADRSDRLFQGSLQLGYFWSRALEIYQRSILIHNQSTYEEDDDSRSYHQWQMLLGVSLQM
ncbi:MAG: hypothetical protein AAF202_13105, partial [Pseudomonadota bacterium]